MKAVIRAIQMNPLLFFSVIDHDVEAAGHGDDELMACFESVTAAISAARNIIEVKNTFYIKWNVTVAFDESEIAARVGDFGEINNAAVFDCHEAIENVGEVI